MKTKLFLLPVLFADFALAGCDVDNPDNSGDNKEDDPNTDSPSLANNVIYYTTIDGNAEGRKIYVPNGSVEKYKAAEGWNEYASDIYGFDF